MDWIALQPQSEAGWQDDPALAPGDDALLGLGWWALQFTPRVVLLPPAVLLEVSGSARLWGGRAALLRRILTLPKPVDLARHARGGTSLLARARLWPGLERSPADELPLERLDAAQAHLATLAALGCRRWGDLRALPRAGLARRFGLPLLQALDRAYGQAEDRYPWLELPEVFESALELTDPVHTAPALLFAARRLLQRLRVWLELRQRAVRALALGWELDRRRDGPTRGELLLRCAEPTLDLAHLQALLAEHLARISLPAPAVGLRLRSVEIAPRAARVASLLVDARSEGEPLAQTLARLAVRLGGQRLLQLRPGDDHRPERMQHWQPVLDASDLIAENPYPSRSGAIKRPQDPGVWPGWLLTRPQPLPVQQGRPLCPDPLQILAGPQRLESGWWEPQAAALRDYFIAESRVCGLLWIYRERLDPPGGPGDPRTPAAPADPCDPGDPRDPDRAASPAAAARWYLHGVYG